ncbi:MAG: response regulator [Candidatus Anammoxibacter sp.]
MEYEHTINKDIEILIVEDSPTQVVQLRYTLEKNGYSVTVAENGSKALASIKNKKPSIIITDVVMPEMNGFEFCQRVKDDKSLSKIPVVLLTTLSDPYDIIKGLDCGADNFITKPYNEDDLLYRIQNIFMNINLRKEKVSEVGIEIFFRGKRHFINASRMQMLDLLFASFETAVQKNEELILANKRLKNAVDTVQALKGLIPICASCKKIRNDKGFWQQVEVYIAQHTDAEFTHSICPECAVSLYPELDLKQ